VRGDELVERADADAGLDRGGIGAEGGQQVRRSISQTVSASGMVARSMAVRGVPASTVSASRPPGRRADAMAASSSRLSSKASSVSSSSTTSNDSGKRGSGGTRPCTKRQGSPAASCRAIASALAE